MNIDAATTVQEKTACLHELRTRRCPLQKQLQKLNCDIERLKCARQSQVEDERDWLHPALVFAWCQDAQRYEKSQPPPESDEDMADVHMLLEEALGMFSLDLVNLVARYAECAEHALLVECVQRLSALECKIRPTIDFVWGEFDGAECYVPKFDYGDADVQYADRWDTEQAYYAIMRECSALADFRACGGYFGGTRQLTPQLAQEWRGRVVPCLHGQGWNDRWFDKWWTPPDPKSMDFMVLHGFDLGFDRGQARFTLRATSLRHGFAVRQLDGQFVNHMDCAYSYALDMGFGTGSGMDGIWIVNRPNPSLAKFVRSRVDKLIQLYGYSAVT